MKEEGKFGVWKGPTKKQKQREWWRVPTKKRKKNIEGKRLLYEILAFALFLFLIYTIVINVQEHIEMKQNYAIEPAVVTVYDKTATKYLFGGINHVALLEPGLIDKVPRSLKDNQKAALTKAQFDTLSPGDSLDGFIVNQQFYTERDLENEFEGFPFVLLMICVYPMGYIIYQAFKFKKVDALFERFTIRFDRSLSFVVNTVVFGGLTVGLLFSYYSLAGTIKYAYDWKTSPDFIETSAEVRHKSMQHGSGTYAEDTFYVALAFKGNSGESIHVTKEVTRSAYKANSREVFIKYKKDNPYDVYAQELTSSEIADLLGSSTMIIYYLTIVITALLLFAVYLLDKKRRTGSY